MPLVVRDFGWGVDRVVDLLVPQMWRRVLGILGRLDSPFLDILVAASCFNRGPLVLGHCSFVGGHSTSSIALEGDGLVLPGRHIVYSHSRMGDFVCCLERGSVGRDPSI